MSLSRRMIRLAGVPLGIVALGATSSAHDGTVTPFTSNSDGALMEWLATDSVGALAAGVLFLDAAGAGADADSAFLAYAVSQGDCDDPEPSSCVVLAAGFGRIPAADVRGSGSGALRVHTDIGANPGFFLWTGPAGVVDVEWVQNRAFTLTEKGTSLVRTGSMTIHRQGTSTLASADAQGSVIGFSVSQVAPADARIGSTRGVTVQIEHQ